LLDGEAETITSLIRTYSLTPADAESSAWTTFTEDEEAVEGSFGMIIDIGRLVMPTGAFVGRSVVGLAVVGCFS
jgi:hypothetical protein